MEKELINLLGEKIIELNKIKVVLLALWKYDLNPEANKIIEQFEEELETKNFEYSDKLITKEDNAEMIQDISEHKDIGEENDKTM